MYAYTKIYIEFDLIQNIALDSGFGFIKVHIFLLECPDVCCR